MTEFTPLASTFGGVLIGLSAIMLMGFVGRIAGMTAIFSAIIPPRAPDWPWRATFLAGAIVAPAVYLAMFGEPVGFSVPVGMLAMIVGGFVVGIGVTFGSGCTSGHGVCGIARFSPRSVVATCVFMASTFATVFVIRHVAGL